ncbi:hypothetical protein GCM10009122_41650 [Fulvivirga kasyanovii]|uniref:DUF4249 domain-containing protein n=1 Tax=Fulvivirga kasyanovii TaxID=396812 RepID=A0ABW9RTX9_9BACT|nr:DUF4249 domain-containing protein [Fulvivirga kasyanovii]MTI27351.1 DUF4249 domain-containing protein [Fulvivirga kasyanovii]
MNIRILLSILTISMLAIACEDTIDVDLKEADPVLVVDAWINDKSEDQIIRLMMSQPYFDQTLPPEVSGATVTVTDNTGKVYNFTEQETGEYVWSPSGADPSFGTIGNEYTLNVQLQDGDSYQSVTTMNRTAQVDSITFTYEEETAFFPESYIAEVWARDPQGEGDSYWIRTYKNGVLLTKPQEINLAFDAAFTEGSSFDGITFIEPIRQGINPLDQDEDDEFLSPYELGDSVYVEIHSISNEAFYFLTEVAIQTDRPGGFGELFAQPLANVPTNIYATENGVKDVVGFFNVAAVSGKGKKLEE